MFRYDVALFGAGKTGKSSLIKQMISGEFQEKYTATVQENYRHLIQLPDGRSKSIEILDTAGSFSFPAMREVYIRRSDLFLIVIALDDKDSLEYAISMKEEIVAIKGGSIPMLLVGNKDDVTKREISPELAAATAKEHFGSAYIETSAKTGRNCTQALVRIFTGDVQNNPMLNLVKNQGSLKKISRKSAKKLLTSTLSDPSMTRLSSTKKKLTRKSYFSRGSSTEEESHRSAEIMDCKIKSVTNAKPGLLRSFSQKLFKRLRRSSSDSTNQTDIDSECDASNDSVFGTSSKKTVTVCYTIKYTTDSKSVK